MWQTIKTAFLTLTRFQQAGLISGLLLILLLFSSAASTFVWHLKDRLNQPENDKIRKQLEDEKLESQKAQARAELLEKQVKEDEAKIKLQKSVIDAAGQRAAEIAKKVDDEERKVDEEMRGADIDIAPDVRAERIRERLRRLYPGAKF